MSSKVYFGDWSDEELDFLADDEVQAELLGLPLDGSDHALEEELPLGQLHTFGPSGKSRIVDEDGREVDDWENPFLFF